MSKDKNRPSDDLADSALPERNSALDRSIIQARGGEVKEFDALLTRRYGATRNRVARLMQAADGVMPRNTYDALAEAADSFGELNTQLEAVLSGIPEDRDFVVTLDGARMEFTYVPGEYIQTSDGDRQILLTEKGKVDGVNNVDKRLYGAIISALAA